MKVTDVSVSDPGEASGWRCTRVISCSGSHLLTLWSQQYRAKPAAAHPGTKLAKRETGLQQIGSAPYLWGFDTHIPFLDGASKENCIRPQLPDQPWSPGSWMEQKAAPPWLVFRHLLCRRGSQDSSYEAKTQEKGRKHKPSTFTKQNVCISLVYITDLF